MDWVVPAATEEIAIQHRDGLDAANNWTHRIWASPTMETQQLIFEFTEVFLTNERVRVIADAAWTALDKVQATVFYFRLI